MWVRSRRRFLPESSGRKWLSVERLMRGDDRTVTRRLAVTNDGQRLRRRTYAEDVPRVVHEHLHNADLGEWNLLRLCLFDFGRCHERVIDLCLLPSEKSVFHLIFFFLARTSRGGTRTGYKNMERERERGALVSIFTIRSTRLWLAFHTFQPNRSRSTTRATFSISSAAKGKEWDADKKK